MLHARNKHAHLAPPVLFLLNPPPATVSFSGTSIYGTEDSACPQCETVFVLPAVTPEAKVAQLALSILAAEVSAEVSKF